jgi:hypothetical protein
VKDDGAFEHGDQAIIRSGIDRLAEAVSKTAHAHGWWSDDDGNFQDRNMGEMIALMHSELSEALESYRVNEPMLWYQYPGDKPPTPSKRPTQEMVVNGIIEEVIGKPQGIASEFADVIIRILDTCYTLDIPIADALLNKHAYNITRPYRHGGKRA